MEIIYKNFREGNEGALIWLNDVLVYANTFDEFLGVLEKMLTNLNRYKVR